MEMLSTTWPNGYSEAEYQSAVERAPLEDNSFYEREVFARRCQKFRDSEPTIDEDLLFLPVGVQPYGPILISLAVPAKTTVLLYSADTKEGVDKICRALPERHFHPLLIEPENSRQVAEQVMAAYEVLGGGQRVTCDQTSGRKPTTVALAGLAASNQWRSVYLRAEQKDKLFVHEELMEMPSLFEAVGGTHRLTALACIRRGAMAAALDSLDLALERSLGSARLVKLQRQVEGAMLFRQANLKGLLRWLRSNYFRQTSQPFSSALQAQVEDWLKDPRPILHLIIDCLDREGNVLAARYLESGYWPDRRHRIQYVTQHRKAVKAARWLDDLVGRKFAEHAQ